MRLIIVTVLYNKNKIYEIAIISSKVRENHRRR